VFNQNLNRALVLFELTPANKISFLDSYKKTLSNCCIDLLRPPRFSGLGQSHRVEGTHWVAIVAILIFSIRSDSDSTESSNRAGDAT
jgi:hypothetical protein